MYHVELRQFPHNFCRFNLTEREMRETILDAWSRGEWIELGERKWSPHQASLTVLEGPQLPVEQLSMGRGWRNAKRRSQDVTELLLALARATESAPPGVAEEATAPSGLMGGAGVQSSAGDGVDSGLALSGASRLGGRLAADSLGLEVLTKLGDEPVPIVIAWQLARKRYPAHSASDCLGLAEHAIRSLADAGIVIVLASGESGEPEPCSTGEEIEGALGAVSGWSSTDGLPPALLRRK